MNTTTIQTTETLAEWEETIALTLIAAWTFGLLAFVNAFGNHQRQAWRGAALYEQTTEAGTSIWRYKTADNTWSAAVRRRGRGLELWSEAA